MWLTMLSMMSGATCYAMQCNAMAISDGCNFESIQVPAAVSDRHVADDAEHDERGNLLRNVPRPLDQPHTVP